MTAQSILVFLQDALHQWDQDAEDKIWRAIDSTSRKMARSFTWAWLRRSVDITQANAATTGYLFPANMIDVIEPVQDSDYYVHERIDNALADDTLSPNPTGDFFYLTSNETPIIPEGTGLAIDKATKALTFSPALSPATYTGDYDGEFIRIMNSDGLDFGLHEMASASTLEHTYLGKRISGGSYSIRPSTCKRLFFCDGKGDINAVKATVHYWVYPRPLIARQIELPDGWEDALKLGALLELKFGTVDAKGLSAKQEARTAYEKALGFAQINDGKPPMSDIKRSRTGSTRRMGWR